MLVEERHRRSTEEWKWEIRHTNGKKKKHSYLGETKGKEKKI